MEDTSAQVSRCHVTKAEILAGTNGTKTADANGVLLTKSVNTGWKADECDALASDIFYLWGMGQKLGSDATDTFVLSLSYDKAPRQAGNGGFGIAIRDEHGNWINAVDQNTGGKKKFVHGPWKSSYTLGTYGVDTSAKTAWAVLNVNGQFAVSQDLECIPGLR